MFLIFTPMVIDIPYLAALLKVQNWNTELRVNSTHEGVDIPRAGYVIVLQIKENCVDISYFKKSGAHEVSIPIPCKHSVAFSECIRWAVDQIIFKYETK